MATNQNDVECQAKNTTRDIDMSKLSENLNANGNSSKNERLFYAAGFMAFVCIMIGIGISINSIWNMFSVKFGYSDTTFFNYTYKSVQYIQLSLGVLLSSAGVLILLVRRLIKV